MAGDSYYGSVTLLLHFNGSNGGTTITDTSKTPKTVTCSGNAVTSTSQSKWGGASGYFDGTGDYMTVADHADLTLDGDFTIECWAYWTGGTSNSAVIHLSGGTEIEIYRRTTTGHLYIYSGSNIITGSTAITDNAWHHIALTRSGTTMKAWLDGVQQGSSFTSSSTYNPSNIYIGAYQGSSEYMVGYIDDVRITKGVCRYNADFSGGLPSAEFYDYAGQLSGNITESLDIVNWKVTAVSAIDGTLLGSADATTTYTINCATATLANVILSPKISYVWSAGVTASTNDLVVAVNPDATPHLWKCTTGGTTGGSEPSWNTNGTTSDNTVTWTYVAPLVDPVAIGCKVPS